LWHFITSLFFMVTNCWPHPKSPSWRTTPSCLSVTAYSVYSQLLFISGARLLHPQPEDMPCHGDMGPIQQWNMSTKDRNKVRHQDLLVRLKTYC
jgi:hypothetical protein